MRDRRRVSLRPAAAALLAAVLAAALVAACALIPSPTPSPTASIPPAATPVPTPTPAPTPRFTNEPDPDLSALIPASVTGLAVERPAVTDYAITPGDIGQAAYGELGARFASLVIAFVREPRLSLYAMRVDPPTVITADLEPHLATAGRYVGISGLEREPWELADVLGHWVWVRPSDTATLPGTYVYTWAADGYVFLMIGINDDLNRALLALLPGEAPPTPSPEPSTSSGSGGSAEPSPVASPS